MFDAAFKARTRRNFFTFKVRTFWQSEVKISVLALWLGALSSVFPYMGIGGYGSYPLFVRARHVQRCVKKCPHLECLIHRFVLALNAGTDTLYTRVYSVSSLWMPCRGVRMCEYMLCRIRFTSICADLIKRVIKCVDVTADLKPCSTCLPSYTPPWTHGNLCQKLAESCPFVSSKYCVCVSDNSFVATRENKDMIWYNMIKLFPFLWHRILCVPEWSYQNFDAILLKKVRRIWQHPFVEQNLVAFLTCVPNISKIHWSLHQLY